MLTGKPILITGGIGSFGRAFVRTIVRDENRLKRALQRIEVVVHAAALKQLPTAEYNPFECIKTDILAAQNSVEASLDCGQHYAILPMGGQYTIEKYCESNGAKMVPPRFSYNSGSNPDFLKVNRLRELIYPHRQQAA